MDRRTPFSYQCNQCGLCCRDKVITLSPYDVLRIARAMGISMGESVKRYTLRRGSLLRFVSNGEGFAGGERSAGGECSALAGTRCSIHRGRPLACRLYPLGIERSASDDESPDESYDRIIALDAAPGSLGKYGQNSRAGNFEDSTAGDFIEGQGTAPYFAALQAYRGLIVRFRARVAEMVDFERVEPREFWRRAVAEALRESGFDANPIIEAIFDADGPILDADRIGCARENEEQTVRAHVARLAEMVQNEPDPEKLAAAAVMLAVSLGYTPGEVISGYPLALD